MASAQERFEARLAEAERRRKERGRDGVPLDGGGGGGHPPDMEQRVAKLETNASEIKATLGRLEPILTRIDTSTRKLEADVGELKGRVAQMPTAWQLLVGIIGIMGATFGLLKMALPH